MCFEIISQGLRGPVVAVGRLVFTDQESRHLDPIGFHIFGIHPVVTYQRVGHCYHLPAVGRIGENLLVTTHAGVEDYLGTGFTVPGETSAFKYPAVFER